MLTGLLCIVELWIAGLNYANCEIWYGAHGWFPGELAFLLHYLLFGITAILLLTFAVREANPGAYEPELLRVSLPKDTGRVEGRDPSSGALRRPGVAVGPVLSAKGPVR